MFAGPGLEIILTMYSCQHYKINFHGEITRGAEYQKLFTIFSNVKSEVHNKVGTSIYIYMLTFVVNNLKNMLTIFSISGSTQNELILISQGRFNSIYRSIIDIRNQKSGIFFIQTNIIIQIILK